VSPPDAHGYCSLGTSVDCVRSALVNSKVIIGIGSIPDAVLTALTNHKDLGIHSEMFSVGVIDLVKRGCVTNNNIPHAVLTALTDHKDLGIHSEMFSVGVIDLVKRGCVTNNKKKMHRGRIVGSFLQPKMTAINSCLEIDLTGQVCADSIGKQAWRSREQHSRDLTTTQDDCDQLVLGDRPHGASVRRLHRGDHVNTHVISQQHKMTAINSCLEIDLTGQVCAGSIDQEGRQQDRAHSQGRYVTHIHIEPLTYFIRGAAEAYDGRGKPIIAIVSQTKKGRAHSQGRYVTHIHIEPLTYFIRGAAEAYDGRGKPIIAIVWQTKKGVSKIVPTLKEGQEGRQQDRAHSQGRYVTHIHIEPLTYFIRGAAEAYEGRGKPIIAIVSQTKKGVSKIVPTLKEGHRLPVWQDAASARLRAHQDRAPVAPRGAREGRLRATQVHARTLSLQPSRRCVSAPTSSSRSRTRRTARRSRRPPSSDSSACPHLKSTTIKTLRQRAYELIKIAHPAHREALEKAAFERLKCMPTP
ncbi:4-hydroxybutyrate CoA-transferase, partial [Operophtera brumata]